MHGHAFSIALAVFAIGAIVSPTPPPPAVVSQVQDILAAPYKAMPEAMRSAAAVGRDVASAQ